MKSLVNICGSRVVEERFLAKVTKTETCWVWEGAKRKYGYGKMVARDGGRIVQMTAHRVSWELHFGQIPQGFNVLHKCDNPCCVNPEHLFLGTQADNVRDMVDKKRHRPFGKMPDSVREETDREERFCTECRCDRPLIGGGWVHAVLGRVRWCCKSSLAALLGAVDA